MKIKLVDPTSKPVSGVMVVADTWRGKRSIQFRANTNAEGMVTWKDAPEDEVKFDILKQGFGDLRNQVLKASDNPMRRPKPTKVVVRGNERLTAGGTVKRAKKRQTSAKRSHQSAK